MDPTIDQSNLHKSRVEAFVASNQKNHTFPILDTCRLDNAHVLPLKDASELTTEENVPIQNLASFVPAAGASSRYTIPLDPLRNHIQQNQSDKISQFINSAFESRLPLPPDFRQNNSHTITQWLKKPKALWPCKSDGISFLQQKALEHKTIDCLDQDIYICPEGMEHEFHQQLKSTVDKDIHITTQDDSLKTHRYLENGQVCFEKNQPSRVPAGHGALVAKFKEIHEKYPTLQGVFIRNIDNVNKDTPSTPKITKRFLQEFCYLLGLIKSIRTHILSDSKIAQDKAIQILRHFEIESSLDPLIAVQHHIFGQAPSKHTLIALKTLYDKPLNILGQVPNEGSDVGGCPVLCQTPLGPVKLCIELPHVSKKDQEQILKNPRLSTHFNPVFVAAELTQPDIYLEKSHPFWLIAKKTFQQQTVYYHETLLYELLGNSHLANLIFLEIPRSLFNPHKSLTDSVH